MGFLPLKTHDPKYHEISHKYIFLKSQNLVNQKERPESLQ